MTTRTEHPLSEMKAAFVTSPGEAASITIGTLPIPPLYGNQVLVKVRASAVNPVDTYIRSGSLTMAIPQPFIPGSDFAGTVEAIGDEVRIVAVGERVWGSNQGWFGLQGTLSEYIVTDEKWLYPMPPGQSFVAAAAGALTGITAHLGLFSLGELKPGEVIFVNGGTGGVGSAVVQLAKWIGAKVIATVGNSDKQKICEGWGADLVLNYREENWNRKVRDFCADTGGAHLWWETQRDPNFENIISLMAQRGRIILMAGESANPKLPIGPFFFKELRLLGLLMMNATATDQRRAALAINQCYQDGKWQVPIGRVFPLEEAAGAHSLQEASTLGNHGALIGKIVVQTSN